MKIPLKYGLLITLGIIAWVVVAHLFVPDPNSKLSQCRFNVALNPSNVPFAIGLEEHSVGSGVFFNLLEIVGIYLGITAKGREDGDRPTFKDGLKTGVAIAFVYALSAALFFLVLFLFVGPKLMAGEPGAQTQPFGQVVLGAFAGLFLGSLVFGLVYSTVISFVLAKRPATSS